MPDVFIFSPVRLNLVVIIVLPPAICWDGWMDGSPREVGDAGEVARSFVLRLLRCNNNNTTTVHVRVTKYEDNTLVCSQLG